MYIKLLQMEIFIPQDRIKYDFWELCCPKLNIRCPRISALKKTKTFRVLRLISILFLK